MLLKIKFSRIFPKCIRFFKAKIFADNPQNREIIEVFPLATFRLYGSLAPRPCFRRRPEKIMSA